MLDLDAAQLLRGGAPVHLRAKTFAVLRHFALNPGRVIGKDELFDRAWPGITVTEDTLTQSIRELRLALGADGAGALRTLPRRGYVLDLATAQAPDTAAARPPPVVILPFATASPDSADAILVDGAVEEITHAAARYGQIRVIARHSAFQFRPTEVPAAEAARRLGADYFVEGTARRVGADLRLSPALCETATGRQIWGETFTLTSVSFREMPTLIAHRVVSRLTLDAERALALHPAAAGTGSLDAWHHFIAGVALLRQYGEGVNERARDHLDAALRLDPGFALAHAYRGLAELVINLYGAAPPAARDTALEHALRAVTLAPDEARCHWVLGEVRLCCREHAAAELHLRRALDLNPSDPDLMALFGYLLTMRGRPEEGIDWLQRALALNPLHPTWYSNDLGVACHHAGRHGEAITHFQMVPRTSDWRHTRLAACHAALGDMDAAAAHMAAACAMTPGWDPVAEFRRGLEVEHPENLEPILREISAAMVAWRARQGETPDAG
ncbi:MAG TPA: winged helix-turn-helix domain-containing protein [Paracoccaceae bacterium]|nr:winged helix-turn-helix domain-containing protein [Paracoccaceae bacterium]